MYEPHLGSLKCQAAFFIFQGALHKLEEAEKAKSELQNKMKEREKPIGLARPIQPEAKPLVTHR